MYPVHPLLIGQLVEDRQRRLRRTADNNRLGREAIRARSRQPNRVTKMERSGLHRLAPRLGFATYTNDAAALEVAVVCSDV